jgi:hypothetical protein
MPCPRPGRRLLGSPLTVALPALLIGLLPAQASAVGGNLNTSAFLENRGWINPALVPPPASGSAAAPGALASEAWYVAPPDLITPPPPWQVGAAGFARAEVLNTGTRDASVQQGTAALARAVASATGRAEAALSAQWRIDVVINPLALPLIGPGLYTQLMDTLGCPIGTFLSATDCSGPERGFSFLHLTQGAFQVTPGQPTGRAGFEETATLASRSNAVTLQGGASFSSDRAPGSLGITWSGGWSDADAAVMPLHEGPTARLFPAGDPRNDLADPFGALGGVRLEALRPLLVSSGFQVGFPHYFGSDPLPFARFTFSLEQVARAGWAFGYGFGTMAANFDDTAVTRLLDIEGLALTGPDGEPVPLAGLLQVHVAPLSPVPEPATALLLGLGGGLLWARRRRTGAMPRARAVRGLGLGALLVLGAAAQAAPPPGWGPAQVTLEGRAFDGTSRTTTATVASPADPVEIAPVSVFVADDLGSSYTWREAVAWARADGGVLRSRAYAAAGQVLYEGYDAGLGQGGSFADATARLLDRLWVPASGYATLELVMSGHIDGGSAGPAAGWPNWQAAWNSAGTMAWRLGTMPSDVRAFVQRGAGFGADDGVPYTNPSSHIGVSDTAGLVTGWQLLDLDQGVRHPGSLAVRVRFNVTAGGNPFELALMSDAYCHAFAGGVGMLTCQAQSNLSNSLHAGSLALFNPDGTAMAGEVFSASGHDWRLPVSVVPEPASAAMALLGMAVLMAARRRPAARAWALPVMLAGWLGAAAAAPGGAAPAEVVVNGRSLDAAARQAIERRTGLPLQPGRWWYDTRSGLWGAEGQGAAGLAPAGIDVGAPLPPQASGGRAGVFFNGRSLADAEIAWLQTLGPVWPGRYWLDAMGNVGLEGQALPFVNLVQLAQARRSGRTSRQTAGGSVVASDGRCVYVSGRASSGIGSFGASNC